MAPPAPVIQDRPRLTAPPAAPLAVVRLLSPRLYSVPIAHVRPRAYTLFRLTSLHPFSQKQLRFGNPAFREFLQPCAGVPRIDLALEAEHRAAPIGIVAQLHQRLQMPQPRRFVDLRQVVAIQNPLRPGRLTTGNKKSKAPSLWTRPSWFHVNCDIKSDLRQIDFCRPEDLLQQRFGYRTRTVSGNRNQITIIRVLVLGMTAIHPHAHPTPRNKKPCNFPRIQLLHRATLSSSAPSGTSSLDSSSRCMTIASRTFAQTSARDCPMA